MANGEAPPRGSAAAAASLRRRHSAGGSAAGRGASTMLQFYTDEAAGRKMSPNTVLIMSIGFIAVVSILHVVGMEQYQQWNQFQNGGVAQPQQGQGTNVPHSGITMSIKPRGLSIGPQQHSYPTNMDSYELSHFQSQSSEYATPDEVFQTGNNYQSQSSYQLEPERVESSSSNKRKAKMLAKNGDPKKGTPNKRWAQEYDDYLIPFLVEQAKKGMKVDKTFKRQAFTAAAAAVNAKFNESYSPENVINHLRVLKTRYQDICKCQNISGAGWDDEKKMITLEGPTYHTWAQAHSRLKEYVNKPLKHYEDLKIICGDDHATGSYRKVIFEQFGGNASETINLDDSTNEMDAETQANAEREHDVRETQGAGSSSVARSKSRASKNPKNRRDVMEMLIEKVGEMAYAMQNARIAHWSEKLSTYVYALDDFEFEVLDKAFNKLYENENEARAFIAKPVMAQRSWMEKFNQKCDEEQL